MLPATRLEGRPGALWRGARPRPARSAIPHLPRPISLLPGEPAGRRLERGVGHGAKVVYRLGHRTVAGIQPAFLPRCSLARLALAAGGTYGAGELIDVAVSG